MKKAAADIDEYIAGFPTEVQKLLQKIRKTIKKAAPSAEEAISYAIPTFKLNGNLVHFAAYQNHIGLYPAPRGVAEFEVEMERYGGGKGTARFPLDEPIPYELIARITTFRVGKNMERVTAKSTKSRSAKKQTASKKKQSAKKRSSTAKKR
jgi:uncharacterized protein YdhG (YjbR/CyaY superfamily)